MGLKIDAKDFLANMSAIKQRSMFAAEKVGQNAAARMEGEAKRNARWTDRTPDHHRLLRLAGKETTHGRIR
mgnify:CR=1 FL=1